ncbi:MAG: D-aminoacyl-tRNA deacylase [Chitinophagaceae bacterium]|jgi:D-tyrosyl-tRNA(Tyr) deacylase
MKAVIQRVAGANVSVDGRVCGQIDRGLLVLIGIDENDLQADADWLCTKIAAMRIFSDENGLMNKSVTDVNGELLLISQFTLIASTKKGNRPSFIKAARPDKAIPLYEYCSEKLSFLLGKPVAKGIFGADMQVSLLNDGPVTIIIDTQNKE